MQSYFFTLSTGHFLLHSSADNLGIAFLFILIIFGHYLSHKTPGSAVYLNNSGCDVFDYELSALMIRYEN